MSVADRRAEVERVIDTIEDPCSVAAGVTLGLATMGILDDVTVSDEGEVSIQLLPTFPACRFLPIFDNEIRRRLMALPWCTRVEVAYAPPDVVWDESRIQPRARARLREHRRRASAGLTPRGGQR